MPNETYTFNVYWAGLALVGTSLESSLAGPTEGGQFGIVMTLHSKLNNQIKENKSTSEKALKVKRSSELTKIKELFEKGLITKLSKKKYNKRQNLCCGMK